MSQESKESVLKKRAVNTGKCQRVRERESIVVTTVVIRRDPNSNCFSKKPDGKGNKAQET